MSEQDESSGVFHHPKWTDERSPLEIELKTFSQEGKVKIPTEYPDNIADIVPKLISVLETPAKEDGFGADHDKRTAWRHALVELGEEGKDLYDESQVNIFNMNILGQAAQMEFIGDIFPQFRKRLTDEADRLMDLLTGPGKKVEYDHMSSEERINNIVKPIQKSVVEVLNLVGKGEKKEIKTYYNPDEEKAGGESLDSRPQSRQPMQSPERQ